METTEFYFEYLHIYKFVERNGVKRLVLVGKFMTDDSIAIKFARKMFKENYFFVYE